MKPNQKRGNPSQIWRFTMAITPYWSSKWSNCYGNRVKSSKREKTPS